MMTLDSIRLHLTTAKLGSDLRLYGAVSSTNEVARALAREGAADGTVVIADEQTAGRGRLGQRWFSPPGVNLYMSVLFRPTLRPSEVPGFSFIGSLALVDAIRGEGLEPAIKWPNDVLVGRKKVAGSLVECGASGNEVDYVILGVGVNLNVNAAALRGALGEGARAAGSLAEAAGREIDRSGFAAAFLNALERWAEVYASKGPAPVLEAWRGRDILTGRRVQVRGEGEAYEGRVLGVDREGYLVLRDPRGTRRRVLTGEIRLTD